MSQALQDQHLQCGLQIHLSPSSSSAQELSVYNSPSIVDAAQLLRSVANTLLTSLDPTQTPNQTSPDPSQTPSQSHQDPNAFHHAEAADQPNLEEMASQHQLNGNSPIAHDDDQTGGHSDQVGFGVNGSGSHSNGSGALPSGGGDQLPTQVCNMLDQS